MKITRRLIFTIAVVACSLITVYNVSDAVIETNGLIYIVDTPVNTYHEAISDNVCLTTVNGLSNICIRLEEEGYELYQLNLDKSYIDVSYIKDDYPTYRLYMTYPECKLTIFSSEYENAYILQSYINGKEKME